MRVDLVSEHASPLAALGGADAGGQNVHVAELARALGRRGHDVLVHTRRDDPLLPEAVPAGENVTVEHVPAGPAAPVPKDELLPHIPQFGAHLAARWRDRRPHVVHAHFWMSGIAAQRGAAGLGVPVLQTFHALGRVKRRHQGPADTSPPERERLEASVARAADLVLATCSDEVRELVEVGVRRDCTAVVPCGIDLAKFAPGGPVAAGSGRPRLLCIGRFVPRKGMDTAIAAMADLGEAELLLAGGPDTAHWHDDPEVARLREAVARHGVGDRVRFLGPVAHDEVPALYRSCTAVLSVPWYEPFGTVPLEAMACGVPPVVSAVGGHLDTVTDDVTGVLVPPRDPERLARALRGLLADPARRRRLGAAGAERARARYGWSRLARETEAAYERLATVPADLGGVP